MDDQLDKILAERISEVFDNYEHPPADEGWAQLRQKFPVEKDNKIAWLWWGSAAAILLVFLTTGLLLLNKPAHQSYVTNKPLTKQGNSQVRSGKKDPGHISFHQNLQATGLQPALQKSSEPASGSINRFTTKNLNPNATSIASGSMDDRQNSQPAVAGINRLPEKNLSPLAAKADSGQYAGALTASHPDTAVKQQPAPDNPLVPANKNIMAMFEHDKRTVKKEAVEKKQSKAVNFSVYAATYFNYASGSSNQINAGAGVTSDIRLGGNLKLSTGISIAQNSLRYNDSPPLNVISTNSNNNTASAVAAAVGTNALLSPARLMPVFKNYNASLVGLDIPVNLKYEFNPQKNDAYVAAGLSSGTFIDEKYTYTYGYSGTGNSASASTQDEVSRKNFNNFYFGKTLNVSFGLGYPLGKNNRLIIEPFLKYPLAGLGEQQIHFGAGGINLKLNFTPRK